MKRNEIILAIIKLHNYWQKKYHELEPDFKVNFWSVDEFEAMTDRFYLVESLSVLNDDYDNKKFFPRIELRYHFRSKEKYEFGKGHQYFYDGYKSTSAFSHEDLNDIEKAMKRIDADFEKHKMKA